MKPNFALTLSFEGISLLQRAFPGWTNLGEVSLASADLMGDLARLRAKAPGGATVKLVLPNDQIKFITLPAPDGDPEEAARTALTGATPYEVDDLSYDFAVSDGQMHIAAVARETLAEAEAFAAEYGFTPLCFVAMPEDGTFTGEPFFGPTAHARSRLAPGESIQRDSAPIRIISAPATPKPVPAPLPKTALDEDASATDEAATTANPDLDLKPEPEFDSTPAPEPQPDATKPKDAPKDKPSAPASGFATIRAARTETPEGPAPKLSGASRLTTLDGTEIPKAAPSVTPPKVDAKPSAEAGTKSGAQVTDEGLDIPAPSVPSPAPHADPALDTPAIAAAAASLIPDPETRLVIPEADLAPPPLKTGSFFSRRRPKDAPKAEADATPEEKDALRKRRAREKERMTIFGARGHEVGGKPRFLGLILTAVLLLFLVGVAAWASVFLDDGLARLFGGPKDIKVSEVSAGDETPEIIPLPSSTGEDLAALEPEPPGSEDIAPLPEITPLPDLPEALSPSEALARYAATGIWQMAPNPPSGDGPAIGTTDVYEAATDPGLRLPEASRLISPPVREMPVAAQFDPPPAGVLFEFDSRGFIRAVQDGIVSPEGIRLVAGRPALLPPEGFFDRLPAAPEPEATVTEAALTPADEAEPDATAPETAQAEAPEVDPAADVTADVTADPALAGLRPRARPEGLAPEDGAAAEIETQTETAALSETDAVLAALRPRARPAEIAAAASAVEAAPEQNASAATLRSDDSPATPLIDQDALNRALTDAAQAAPVDPSLFENPTAQAVSASLTPNTRPSDFASTVERIQEQTAATPVPVAQVLTPSLPSRASVAREATQKNAINLRKINLIGVYGSPNSRRALVRLGNGRYKKVQVGDRLDGGQVAAIGDSELRYVKRGRNLTLQMPQS
ncbi:hypothetical protein KUD11_09695 [Roseovarius sp. LXJ103]|uniref:hypothetical protein n=1 Tax=Roseovarius carneus TaxID=2853164 RepID=UPI000D6228FC|nr:hypothetical protein [Roseovarius carneus]MBZ8118921.1 hypothetical protein [Roseovarius carneus]PWE35422.1 hypothetical protein DD563_05255 [Pelagicola sp. LXJ1103]